VRAPPQRSRTLRARAAGDDDDLKPNFAEDSPGASRSGLHHLSAVTCVALATGGGLVRDAGGASGACRRP
jgi:hypothetical protein